MREINNIDSHLNALRYRYGKQGWYAKTIEVAQCIDRLDAQNTPSKETTLHSLAIQQA